MEHAQEGIEARAVVLDDAYSARERGWTPSVEIRKDARDVRREIERSSPERACGKTVAHR
jgi:hypothetical protein